MDELLNTLNTTLVAATLTANVGGYDLSAHALEIDENGEQQAHAWLETSTTRRLVVVVGAAEGQRPTRQGLYRVTVDADGTATAAEEIAEIEHGAELETLLYRLASAALALPV